MYDLWKSEVTVRLMDAEKTHRTAIGGSMQTGIRALSSIATRMRETMTVFLELWAAEPVRQGGGAPRAWIRKRKKTAGGPAGSLERQKVGPRLTLRRAPRLIEFGTSIPSRATVRLMMKHLVPRSREASDQLKVDFRGLTSH